MWGRILGTILSATLIGDGPTAELARSEPWGLIARLGVGQPAERAAALEALEDRAVPALKAAQSHQVPEVRDCVTRILGQIEDAAYWRRHREVLGWLPTDIQVIVAARGPWRDLPDHNRVRLSGDSRRLEDLFRSLALGDLYDLSEAEEDYAKRDGRRVPFRALVDRPLTLALAARRISGNKAGESCGSSCHVVLFRDDLGTLGDAWFKDLEAFGLKAETIGNVRVVAFDKSIVKAQNVGSAGGTIYLARPAPDLVITTTDRALMADVLIRRAGRSRQGGRALPDSLPEWGSFDPKARAWAIRHYDRPTAPLDLTSPIGEKDGELLRHLEIKFGANGFKVKADEIVRFFMFQDGEAIGLAFTLKDGEATLRYLSPNPEALGAMTSYWRGLPQMNTTTRQAAPGVIEVTLPANKIDTAKAFDYFIFLDWFFGRGACGGGMPPAFFNFHM